MILNLNMQVNLVLYKCSRWRVKSEEDNSTIGVLICKGKNKTVVEYALKDVNKPIGVSEYQLTHELKSKYKSALPTIEQIEAEVDEK